MTGEERAYLAGLIDGEGSITLSRHHRGQLPQPRISIAKCNREVLEWVRERTGRGVIISRRPRKAWHHAPFVWQVQLAGGVIAILEEVEPYLIVKCKQARLLLDRYKQCTPRNGKYSPEQLRLKLRLVDEVRRLNEASRAVAAITRQAPPASAGG